ncbi:MAG: discoidin domain-containing protein [Deltaproteobacteria bacterium]|nr:MAG: discoidin domain-containing protein [Deltaproteobacteria bacterium]
MKKTIFLGGFFLSFSFLIISCGTPKAQNILLNKSPIQSQGISQVQKMTDGHASGEGDYWASEQSSVFQQGSDAFVIYDLGSATPLRAFYIQGDNNDTYQVLVSDDLQTWKLIWSAGFRGGAGLRERWSKDLNESGRYLKLQALGGDGAYSVSEFQAYVVVPDSWKPDVDIVHSNAGSFAGRLRMVIFGLSLVLYSLFSAYKNKTWVYRVVLIPALTTYELFRWMIAHLPIDDLDFAFLKLVISLVGIFVLVQNQFFVERLKPAKNIVKGILFTLGLFAIGIYYHFGHLQFDHAAERRPTVVHTWDMRVYYPIAKFFRELQFDGLYLACLQGYLEEHPETTDAELANVRLRNLNNNEIVSGLSVKEDAKAIKSRFTPERWEEFRHDMRWFDRAMGRNYLGSMVDHGGNATPLWMGVAHLIFKDTKDVEGMLTLAAWMDPILLLIFFIVVGRTFGWNPMCLCMIIFGATEFYRFGSNLMGSTLRQDWLVAFGLGVCALRQNRYYLGGIGLAYSSLIRAFPALGVLGLGLWWLSDVGMRIYRKEKISLPILWKDYIPFWKTAIGATLCVALSFGITSATFGYKHSWKPWFEKITMHADKPNVNHLGFRNLFSFDSELTSQKLAEFHRGDWIQTQRETFAKRKFFVNLAILFSLVLILRAMRQKDLHQISLLGLLLIPVFFYPANYYFHYVFLLPLLGAFSKDKVDEVSTSYFTGINVILLTMCTFHYFTLLEGEMDVSFTQQSWLLMIGFGLMLLVSNLFTKQKS